MQKNANLVLPKSIYVPLVQSLETTPDKILIISVIVNQDFMKLIKPFAKNALQIVQPALIRHLIVLFVKVAIEILHLPHLASATINTFKIKI